ncbi:MAG: hypothetical protein ACSLFM_11060 [Tepidiformaceae bacterium]
MALETERRKFDELHAELVRNHEGQFALLHDSELEGTFTTFAEAYEAGVRAHGTGAFMVRQITHNEQHVLLPALNAGVIFVR